MVQSVLFENLPYTSKKHTFRNREEIVNSNVLVFKNSRIGIGTQEPEENYRVTISGNTVIRGTLTAEILSYTASNLNHLTIDNLGTQEGINLIQRGYDPFITFRSNEYGIVDIIDGNGNLGIGTSIAYESLVVQGTVVAKDLLLTGESIYQKPLQVPPIHQTFIVQDRADLDFLVETDGIYAASNEDVEVYLNGYKLAYYNSNLKDYVVSYSNEYNPPKTYFNITLTSVAKSQDVIDITFWPRTLDQVQGTLGGYSTQSIYSYWDKALDNAVYYSGNVGIGTYKPISKLDVRGRVTATDFYGNGAGLSNVPGAFEKINQRDAVYLLGNIGIGTTLPRQKLDVQGNIFSSGSIVCSNINALGTFIVLNTISSNTDRMVIENMNTSTALQVTQTGLNFPIAVFEKTCNEAVLFIDNNGKVGINTNSPIESLDIRGNMYVSGNIQCSNISTIGEFTTITTATNQTEQLIVVNAGTSTAFKVTQNGYNKVAEFFQSNISLLQVAYDGNIGIGTDVPVEKLDVQGNILGSNLRLAGTSVSIQTHPTATLNLQAGLIQVQSDILPTACNVYNLGSSNYRFKDLYLSGNTIDLDGTQIKKDSLTGGVSIFDKNGNLVELKSKTVSTEQLGIGTNASKVAMEIWASNAMLIPKGTTLQRPSDPTSGYLRYNTELNSFEGYGLQWGAIGGGSPWSSNDKNTYHIYGNVGIGTTAPKQLFDVSYETSPFIPGTSNLTSTLMNVEALNLDSFSSDSLVTLDTRGYLYRSGRINSIGSPTPLSNLDQTLSPLSLPANTSVYIVKYTPLGEVNNYLTFQNGINIKKILCDTNHHLYIAGVRTSGGILSLYNFGGSLSSSNLAAAGNYNAFLLKYNLDGSNIGATTVPSNYPSIFRGLAINSEQSVYVAGNYLTTNTIPLKDLNGSNSGYTLPIVNALGNYHPLIIKYGSNGSIEGYNYIQTSSSYHTDIQIDTNDNIYTTGYYTNSTLINFDGTSLGCNLSPSQGSMYVIKYNRFGFVHSYVGGFAGNGFSMANDINNNLYVTGFYKNSSSYTLLNFDKTSTGINLPSNPLSVILLKYNSTGIYQGHSLHSLDNTKNYLPYTKNGFIHVDTDQSIYYTGMYNRGSGPLSNLDGTLSTFEFTSNNGIQMFILKYNANGKIQSLSTLPIDISVPTSGVVYPNQQIFYLNTFLQPNQSGTYTLSNLDGSISNKTITTSSTYHSLLLQYKTTSPILPTYQSTVLDNKGNLGIGVLTPLQALDVNGISYFRGNVGIGTLTPIQPLDVNGISYFRGNATFLGNIGVGTNVSTQSLNVQGNTTLLGNIGIGTVVSGQRLDVQGNTSLRGNVSITNDTTLLGNLGVGTLTPTQRLDVRGNIYSSGTITCSNISIIGDFVTMNTVTSNTEQIVIENAGTGPALKVTQTGVNSLAEFYDKESGIALYINNGGNVGIGTNVTTAKLYVAGQIYATENITAFSDATYKTNIQRIPNALEKLTNVHGYTFNKLNDPNGKSYMGVLAQEIEPVFPELIEKQGDTLSVAYGNMVAPLIEMIHELKQRVEALEKKWDK